MKEKCFRQIMTMMSIAEANYNSREFSNTRAITELIHPMQLHLLKNNVLNMEIIRTLRVFS